MFSWNRFPYTSFTNVNLDWILEKLNGIEKVTGAIVTPEKYGAVGDGVHDDTQALIEAFSSGKICICGGTYKFTNVVTVTTLVMGGTFLFYDAARFDVNNGGFVYSNFDSTNLTRDRQTMVSCTGGNNVVNYCAFSPTTAEERATQVFADNCIIDVENTSFGVIRVNTVNGVQGDEVGTARHIRADNCTINIRNNVFALFDGTDNNYVEDSDAIHLRYCDNAVIDGNSFSGYAKSCIKVQYGNATVINNTFDCTYCLYVVRWHETPKHVIISNNIMRGDATYIFYTQDGEQTIINDNSVIMSCRELISINNGTVTFDGNEVMLEDSTMRTDISTKLFHIVNCFLKSNSVVKSTGTHRPYYTYSNYDCEVYVTGIVESAFNSSYNVYKLRGAVIGLKNVVLDRCSNLDVKGATINFVACSNITGDITFTAYGTIKNSQHMRVNFIADGITTYISRLNNSQDIVINLYGNITSTNIITIEDGNTSTGVIINYATFRTGIYDVLGNGVVYKATSMLT